MFSKKSNFALFFGNRGFFPGELVSSARKEMSAILTELGHEYIMADEKATRYGAVETPSEGRIFADFLDRNRGKFDGVILSLPNFGDETGAVEALKNAGVPIMIQAYPDELDKMSPRFRRDAFCGKLSIMDVFCQYKIPFTILPPHTISPLTPEFRNHIDFFDRVCRVVRGMRMMTVGAIGARTTPFKTVRIDETALQNHGITTETFDLSSVFAKMEKLNEQDERYKTKTDTLKDYSSWHGVPSSAFKNIVRLSVVLDEMIEEHGLDAIAVRCWVEMQEVLGISPCVVLSEINNRGIPAACEVDVGNAVTMFALSRASGSAAACLDWNNNYGQDNERCILFHCGPVPSKMMKAKGNIVDHEIVSNSVGKGRAYGCNQGRIAEGPFTFGSMLTDCGKLEFYAGEGIFTQDVIPDEFFGCAGVAKIKGLQDVLQKIGYRGHRHHASVVHGTVLTPVREAFEKYLGYSILAF